MMYEAVVLLCLCFFVEIYGVKLRLDSLNYQQIGNQTEIKPGTIQNQDGTQLIITRSSIPNEIKKITNFSITTLVFENDQHTFPTLTNLPNLAAASIRCFNCHLLKNTSISSTRLHAINLAGNNLNKIENNSFGADLEFLFLSDNHLKEFSFGWFQNVTNLKTLNLSNNSITTLPGQTLPFLTFLDLSRNNLEDISKGLLTSPMLKMILLIDSNIKTISDDTFGVQLLVVNLRQNNVNNTKIFLKSPNLLDLDLSLNHFNSIPNVEHCKKLKRLSLNNNHVQKLQLNELPESLQEINMESNMVASIKGCFGSNYTKINLNYNPISDVTNLFIHATSLEELVLGGGRLTDFPILENCGKLKTLEVFSAIMPRIHQKYFKGIQPEHINLSSNQIEQIDANTFGPNLKHLNLQFNDLKKIDFLGQTPNIEVLNLGWNQLNRFPNIKQHKKLRILELGVNQLEYVPRNILPDTIETISLNNNRLKHLHEDTFGPSLKFISLNQNQLKDCANNFVNTKNLEELQISFNQLQTVPYLNQCSQLEKLDLIYNSIKYLNRNVFNNTKLESISLFDNQLVYIEPGAFPPSIKIVDLSKNELIDVSDSFRNLTNLTELTLTSNRLISIPNLNDSPNLEGLNVFDNEIKRLSKGFLDLTKLKRFEAGLNSIEEVENYPFGPTIEHIDLENNKLEDITNLILHANNLKYLKVFNNTIRFLPMFDEVRKLETLEAGQNRIERIEDNTFAATMLKMIELQQNLIGTVGTRVFSNQLEDLILSNNRIKKVSADWFLNKTALKYIDLSGNQIEVVPSNLFRNFSGLRSIRLSYNKIEWIGPGAFDCGNHIQYLQLENNRLCELDANVLSSGVVRFFLLNLDYNRISFLSRGLLRKVEADALYIIKNPWQCECWDEIVRWWVMKKNKTVFRLYGQHTPSKSRPLCISTMYDYCIDHVDDKMAEFIDRMLLKEIF